MNKIKKIRKAPLSIGGKLVLAISIAAIAAFSSALLAAYLSAEKFIAMQNTNLKSRLEIASSSASHYLDAAIDFGDNTLIIKLLKELKKDEHIKGIAVYNIEGKVIEQISDTPELNYLFNHFNINKTPEKYLYIQLDIMHPDRPVGMLRVLADNTNDIKQAYHHVWYILSSMIIFLSFILFSIVFFISRINARLKRLVDMTKRLNKYNRYHMVSSHQGKDELTIYSDNFNVMLDLLELQSCELEAFNLQLYRNLLHDSLSGLPNRRYLNEYINQHIQEKSKESLALVLLDIDHLKRINDKLGSKIGDQTIETVGHLMRRHLPSGIFSAHISGDEFALVMTEEEHIREVLYYFQKLQKEFIEASILNSHTANQHAIKASLTAGLALYPEHAMNYQDLLTLADHALHQAKQEQRGKLNIYTNQEHNNIAQKVINKQAIEQWNLSCINPLFQPIFRGNGSLLGVECLATYIDHHGATIRADAFIAQAEEENIIDQIDLTMLRKSLEILTPFIKNRQEPFYIFVNFSINTISKPNFYDQFTDILERGNIPPEYIVLEVTESTSLTEACTKTLNCLADKKIQLCLDDFGTGYTNPSYFKHIKWSIMKIDKRYVIDITKNKESRRLVESFFNLAHLLNLKVVAEGIEEQHYMDILREYKCDYYQGYHLGMPWNLKDLQKIHHLS